MPARSRDEDSESVRPSRICRACGHIHPYDSPFYRCQWCRVWGQDFYEIKSYSEWFDSTRKNMSNIEEHGKILGLSHMYFWSGVTAVIAVVTLVMMMKPVWLGFEREAFVESYQYVESHKDKMLTDVEKYDELEVQILMYEKSGDTKIVDGLRMQQRSLKKRIRASLAKIPAQHHPNNVERFSR